MKILVFGSSGMVGSSLLNIGLDHKKDFEIIGSNREKLDLFNKEETFSYISELKPDVLINAAAKVGGIYANSQYKADFIIENLKINLNIAEAIKIFPEILNITIGSSCIYPLGTSNPMNESQIMTGKLEPTNSPYAMAKLANIETSYALHEQYKVNYLNLLPTNLYGPYDKFNVNNSHVIPSLISKFHNAKMDQKKSVTLWGTGKPLREFLFVDDLANAIFFLIENNIVNKTINIGSEEEISILDLALLIKEITNYKGEIVFDKTFPDGNPRKLLDSTQIKNLGWTKKTDLKTGLNKTYDWYLKNII